MPQRLPDGTSVFLPRKALAAKAHRVTELTTENGTHVAVWTLPTTDGGTCYVYNRGSGCPPPGYEQTEPMAASLASGSNPMLLLGAGHTRGRLGRAPLRGRKHQSGSGPPTGSS